MMKNYLTIAILIKALFLGPNMIMSQSPSAQGDYSTVCLERTEVRNLYSEIVRQEFELYVSLPHSYAETSANYPVIYILDAYRSFAIVKGYTDVLTFPAPQIPEVILVGIGYGGAGMEGALNWVVGRTRDLSPVKDRTREEYFERAVESLGVSGVDIATGGAPLFLDFLQAELIPFIESNYRIDSEKRMLLGYSLGGLFGFYTLFQHPEMFENYLLGSPSIASFNDTTMFDCERNYARTHTDLKANVFMSCGEFEEQYIANMNKMAERLHSRNYKHLKLYKTILDNATHVSGYPAAISRGFAVLFSENDNE